MKNKLLIGICILFLLVPSIAFAVRTSGTVVESSSVSRMVGDTPYDIINQLDTKQLDIHHATHLSNRIDLFEDTTSGKPIFYGFPNDHNIKGDESTLDDTYTPWKGYLEMNNELDQFNPTELFLMESYVDLDDFGIYTKSITKSDKIYPADVREWLDEFAENSPLFIMNIEGTGLALPNEDSYVNALTRYATIIAPKDVRSSEFAEAVMCNLHDNQMIGDVFRRARTKYYTETKPSDQNLPGIVLKSYALYGNPLTRVDVPSNYEDYISQGLTWYNSNTWFNPCWDYYVPPEEYIYASSNEKVLYDALNSLSLAPSITASLGDAVQQGDSFDESIDVQYNIINRLGYQIINSSLSYDTNNPDMLGIYTLRAHRLPKGSIIKDLNYTFLSPVDITLPDYPSVVNGNITDRQCIDNNQTADVSYIVYEEDYYDEVVIRFNPLEVVDCMSGELKLYTSLSYRLSYLASNPFYFDNLRYEDIVAPGSIVNLSAQLVYVTDDVPEGKIKLMKGNDTLFQKDIMTRLDEINFMFTSEDTESVTKYKLIYEKNGTEIVSAAFDIQTKFIDGSILVDTQGNSATASLELFNYDDIILPVEIDARLTGPSKRQVYSSTNNLLPGKNTLMFNIDQLSKADGNYGLEAYVNYANSRKVFSDAIVTNHPPSIIAKDQIFRVGENVDINYSIFDQEGDRVFVDIDIPLPWVPTEGDIGLYNVTLTARDDYLSSDKTISLAIIPSNYYPDLDQLDNITIDAGEVASVILYADDLDGNNLTYTMDDSRFIQIDDNWFEWITRDNDTGNYTFEYGVDDGADKIISSFKLQVNPPPPPCFPDWECGLWGSCLDGWQNRNCVDIEGCEADKTEWQECDIRNSSIISAFADNSTEKILNFNESNEQKFVVSVPSDSKIISAVVSIG